MTVVIEPPADPPSIPPEPPPVTPVVPNSDLTKATTTWVPPGTKPDLETITSKLRRQVLRAVPVAEPPANFVFDSSAEVWVVAPPGPFADALRQALADRGAAAKFFAWTQLVPPAPNKLAGLVIVAPLEENEELNLRAFRWLQRCGPALKRHGRSFVASVTRMDGQHGLTGRVADPRVGGLAGLVKTAGHEWDGVRPRVIDIDPAAPDAAVAPRAVAELLDDGPVEIGLTAAGRFRLDLIDAPLQSLPAFGITAKDSIVITGGARGVTAEVAAVLAQAGQPALLLLGRSPWPSDEPPGMSKMMTEADIKRAIRVAAGKKLTPPEIEAEYRKIQAGREVRATVERVKELGSPVSYLSVDVRDPVELAKALAEFRRASDRPITGLIHGAGVLADKRLDDMTEDQFQRVFETKVEGAENLLKATAQDPLRFVALFSSTTARLGRVGQANYAAANEVLNKTARQLAARKPKARVVAVNWGPWDGGMVTPALRAMFAKENVGVIPLDAGARHLLAELSDAQHEVESVVLAAPPTPPTIVEPANDSRAVTPRQTPEPLVREIDLESCPVLHAHQIDGRAVMPLALSLEWLAAAAIREHRGLTFTGFDDVQVFRPLIVPDDRKTTVIARPEHLEVRDGVMTVPVRLLAIGEDGRELQPACQAKVMLAEQLPTPPRPLRPTLPQPYPFGPERFYAEVLFHGPPLQGLEEVICHGPAGINAKAANAPPPIAWMARPLLDRWVGDPLVTDCAFQLLILWCHRQRGMRSLPSALKSYRQFVREFPEGGARIVAHVTRGDGDVVRADLEFVSQFEQTLVRVEGYECTLSPALDAAFRQSAERAAT